MKTLYKIEGEKKSDAEKIYKLLHKNYEKLPFIRDYDLLLGPNSNSFTQWVLDYVSPKKYPLPLRAWGRGWKL